MFFFVSAIFPSFHSFQVTSSKTTDAQKSSKSNSTDERMVVRPEPGATIHRPFASSSIDLGFCLKTKRLGDENHQEKVFINVCTSAEIGAPRDITEEELIDIVKSEDPGRFRVPISLGEPVADLDKSRRFLFVLLSLNFFFQMDKVVQYSL